ncbi:MAG: glycosyltransferase family 39 protein [Caulobacterales bacterium]
MLREESAVQRVFAKPSIVLGGVCLLLHLILNTRYGVFRDELYFIVCGQHPALGYVDQPPLAPMIAAASHALFGTALEPLRLAPALAMSATVALTAEFARILGGGRFAQWLCGVAVLLAPVFLVDGLILTTDFMQPLTWLGCSWCLVRLVQTKDERWWIAIGAIVGVSMASKYLIGFYIAGLAVGVLATPLRASLLRPWLYIGALLALALSAPSLYWQAQHGWPFLELGKAGLNGKNLALSPLGFFGQELVFPGPVAAPIWLAGLWRFGVRPPLPQYRVFAIAYVLIFALIVALHGKPYYLTPIVPTLFAGGAVAIESWLASVVVRRLAVGAVAVSGILVAPFALPILPPDHFQDYAHALGIQTYSAATEREAQGVLPQQLADMFGWPGMAAQIAAVYQALPPAERAKAVFFGRNYGEAAAVDVYGPALHGPPAISGNNNYFLWGPKGFDGSVVIALGGDHDQLSRMFNSIEVAGAIHNPYAMPYETNVPIYVLRGPRMPLNDLWPSLKHYE